MVDESLQAKAKVLRLLIEEIQLRLEHPEHYTEREREQQRKLLQIRQLELRDLERARWGD